MLEKIKNYFHHPVVAQLRDVQTLGLLIFAVVVLLVSWSGVKAIQTNYVLQKQISRLQQENDIQELANTNQRLKNEYYNTSQYLELAARQNFGLAAPGEKILIVPKDVAMAQVSGVGEADSVVSAPDQATARKPFYQRNAQAWIDFFLHRDSDTI